MDTSGRIFSLESVSISTTEIKVYKKRWFILFLYSASVCFNVYHWIQYSIIANTVVKFYDVPVWAVDALSMAGMIGMLLLIIPVVHLLNNKGLRVTVLISTFGTALGAWIKVLSTVPDRFYVTIIGQCVTAVFAPFLCAVPPKLAAVWFGANEVSTACAIGVFGVQVGITLGFVLPPWMVDPQGDTDKIGSGMRNMFYVGCSTSTILFFLILFCFPKEPPNPPSPAQAKVLKREEYVTNKNSFKNVLTNKNFLLLLISYGTIHGTTNALNTLVNQIILLRFPNHETDAGQLGTLTVAMGIFVSPLLGLWLDKTHRFKQTSIVLTASTFTFMLGSTFTIFYESLPLTYVCYVLLGCSLQAFFALGYEYCVELTYPEPEGTSGSLITCISAFFFFPITVLSGWILRTYGDLPVNLVFCSLMALGIVLTASIKEELKRLAAQKEIRREI